MIRNAEPGDAEALALLYNDYVLHSVTTFEEDPVSAEDMAVRVADVQALRLPWLVSEAAGELCGYACAVRWKGRAAYRHTVESTIYLAARWTGAGRGLDLYSRLLSELESLKVHSVLGGIALPNEPSVRLHEKLGFVKVAHLEQVGHKFGRWIDVGYWQRLLVR